MISDDLRVISNVFVKLSHEKYIVEKIELIMVPVWNLIHLSEFVFQKSQAIVISWIQNHSSELRSIQAPMMDSLCSHLILQSKIVSEMVLSLIICLLSFRHYVSQNYVYCGR